MRQETGLDELRAMLAGELALPPVAGLLGCALLEVEHGRVVLGFEPRSQHLNQLGVVQGGVGVAVCDAGCAAAVQSALPSGALPVSLGVTANFPAPMTTESGVLRCEAVVLSVGNRAGWARALLTDEENHLCVHATGTFSISHQS